VIILFKKPIEFFLIFSIGLSFLYGVLSYQHYSPSSHDFYINTISFFICSLGIIVFFFKKNKLHIKLNSILWILIFFILLIQPVINNIIYVDGLIFPLAQILFVLVLSVAISNISDKEYFIKKMAMILIVSSLFLFFTQIFHVFKIFSLVEIMRLPLQTQRFSGNLFQPNQTAFVFVLGVISIILLLETNRFFFLKYICIIFLSIGVALTASRAGFVMLLLFSLIFNIYINYFNRKNIFVVKYFFFSLLGLIIGICLYSYVSEKQTVFGRISTSFDDVRWNLLHQTGLIILDHPFKGVGWKNFASTGLQYYEQIGWLGLTDHSHFIFGQILSEFGLLGLILILFFSYVLIKNIFLIKNVYDAFILIVLLVFVVYSCFEYPLWYFRYLMIFSIFLSLFDKKEDSIYIIDKGYLISFIGLFLSLSSIYYAYQYRQLAYVNDVVFDTNISNKVKFEKILNTNFSFGFSYFNDLFLYQTISADGFFLKESIEVGERLINYIPLNEYLIKQGTLVGLDKQKVKSYKYFKASCYYHGGTECENTKLYLKELARSYPEYFESIYKKIDSNF